MQVSVHTLGLVIPEVSNREDCLVFGEIRLRIIKRNLPEEHIVISLKFQIHMYLNLSFGTSVPMTFYLIPEYTHDNEYLGTV
jgi:hypothetical protein